jgi:hypothetical protein
MKLTELILGVAGDPPSTLAVRPNATGLTIIPIDRPTLLPELVALAIKDTLSSPERRALKEDLPFIRITAAAGDVELAVADDASLGLRLLTETRKGGVPLILEAKADSDDRVEALLLRVAIAAGADEPEHLFAMLAGDRSANADTEAEASPEALAYVDAHRRATLLAKAVRAIDDRMTASVVPDWLWIATGLGGVGVFLTVIALLYPDLRIYVVPMLSIAALLGFLAYGLRAFRELKVRGELQLERREVRARREAARAEAKDRHAALARSGRSPEEVLMRHAQIRVPPDMPAIIGARELDAKAITFDRRAPRQTIVFLDAQHLPRGLDEDLIQRLRVIPS